MLQPRQRTRPRLPGFHSRGSVSRGPAISSPRRTATFRPRPTVVRPLGEPGLARRPRLPDDPAAMTLDQLNQLPAQEAWIAFERCCGASAWVEQMCSRRPFRDQVELLREAERAAAALGAEDWREAFAHHPRIGDVTALRERFEVSNH